jgi:hypothetical protein
LDELNAPILQVGYCFFAGQVPVDIVKGLTDDAALRLATKLGFSGDLAGQAAKQFKALYALFLGTDATQVEINPLAVGYLHGQPKKGTVLVSLTLCAP